MTKHMDEIRKMKDEELATAVTAKKQAIATLKLDNVAGGVQDSSTAKKLRQEVARMKSEQTVRFMKEQK